MKLGIIGLPGSGKSTVFKALTGGMESPVRKGHREPGLGVVHVDDERLDYLADCHKPQKVTPVQVEFHDIAGITGEGKPGREIGDTVLGHIRTMDALVHCIRYFDSPVLGEPVPLQDFESVEDEMMLSDLSIVEKRIERLEKDIQRGRKELTDELELLKQAGTCLNEGRPLRTSPSVANAEKLKGFAFLTAKPELFLINAGDDKSREDISAIQDKILQRLGHQPDVAIDSLYADAEAEIARLDPEDAQEFLEELQLEEGAKSRIIKKSFELLQLIVFLTAGDKEVRAWPLKKGENAITAAGTIHTDIQKGFIRAEVVSFDDFKETGSTAEAQKSGKYRLEGKEYPVQDGDIIYFRFNV